MHVEDPTPGSPNTRAPRLEEGCSLTVYTIFPNSRKTSMQAPSAGEAPPPPTTLWSGVSFDILDSRVPTFLFPSSFLLTIRLSVLN